MFHVVLVFVSHVFRAMVAYMRNKKHGNNYSYTTSSLDLVKLEIYTERHINCGRPTSQMGAGRDSLRWGLCLRVLG